VDLGVVTPFPPRLTGIGQYGHHLCRGLAGSGAFDRVVVLAEEGPPTGGRHNDVLAEWRWWPYGHPLVGVRLLAALTRAQPHVVWVNFGFSMFGPSPAALLSGLMGLTAASLRGLPMVITLHEPGLFQTPLAADFGVCPLFRAAASELAGWVARLGCWPSPSGRRPSGSAAGFPRPRWCTCPTARSTPRSPAGAADPERPLFRLYRPVQGPARPAGGLWAPAGGKSRRYPRGGRGRPPPLSRIRPASAPHLGGSPRPALDRTRPGSRHPGPLPPEHPACPSSTGPPPGAVPSWPATCPICGRPPPTPAFGSTGFPRMISKAWPRPWPTF